MASITLSTRLCECGGWIRGNEKHVCKPIPFNVVMTEVDNMKRRMKNVKY